MNMKRVAWVLVTLILMAATGAGVFLATRATTPSGGATAGKTLYYCPMHPNYVSDKPGECPICNMELVPMQKEESPAAAASMVPGHATVAITPERRQLIGVQTGVVERRPVTQQIRAVATVDYNERGLSTVNLRFSGWVEELLVKSVGEPVRKGQPLMVLYSPEFLEAQRNYRIARDSAGTPSLPEGAKAFAETNLQSARERLLLWGATEEQVRELDRQQAPNGRITIQAQSAGIVTARNVVQGAYAETGKDLLQIADLSTVWINAEIYEYELPLVRVGAPATLTLAAFPGEQFTGEVSYIYPYLNEKTRTARVRLVAENPEGKLKPGMYATALLAADLGERLVVDANAVLDTGVRQIVFVDLGDGRLEPRAVAVGPRVGGQAIILKGLEAGEQIVTSGNFLVDSESQMKSAFSGAMTGMTAPAPMPEHQHP